jgi:hypothetical protein
MSRWCFSVAVLSNSSLEVRSQTVRCFEAREIRARKLAQPTAISARQRSAILAIRPERGSEVYLESHDS